MNESEGDQLLGDALPLEIADIDGQKVTFIWYFQSGVDRLSLMTSGQPLGVIEKLESHEPKLIPDSEWIDWLAADIHAERIIARAKHQWRHRGEIVADRALAQGGRP